MRLPLPAATLLLLCALGTAHAQTSPSDYAALVEPDDREVTAVAPLKARMAADPTDSAAARELLFVYQRYGDAEAGLPLGMKLAADHPDDVQVLKARLVLTTKKVSDASLFSVTSALDELLSLCERERARDPRLTPAISCIAQFHLVAPSVVGGDEAKAEDAIKAMQELDAGKYLMLRAAQALKKDDKEGAAAKLTEAVPLLTEARDLASIASQLWQLEHKEAALAALDRAATLDPAEPLVLFNQGRVAALSGQRLEAGRDSLLRFLAGSTWIQGKDNRGQAHWRLGMIFEALGDKATAEKAYRRAAMLDPKRKEIQASLKVLTGHR